MMLKQSPSRNLRAKRSLKVKDALWIFVLLAFCVWFLYQVKQSYIKKGALEGKLLSPVKGSSSGENEYQMLKIGRKDLKPWVENSAGAGVGVDEEVDSEDDELGKVRETEEEGGIDRDEEIELGEKEKSDETEHDQLQDLIDEDDKDT